MSLKYDVKVGKFLDNSQETQPPVVSTPQDVSKDYLDRANSILDGADRAVNATSMVRGGETLQRHGDGKETYSMSVLDKADSLL